MVTLFTTPLIYYTTKFVNYYKNLIFFAESNPLKPSKTLTRVLRKFFLEISFHLQIIKLYSATNKLTFICTY